MIGIAMSSRAFRHELKHCYREESIFNQYKPLAERYQVDFCMYNMSGIPRDLKPMKALVYSCADKILIRDKVPLPRVNIVRNTSYVMNQELAKRFETLYSQDIHFINFPLYRQADKLQNYEYLNAHPQLKNHVPPTRRLSLEHLNSFIRQYDKVIIKPIYGSKGRGITILEKEQHQYQVCQTYPNQKTTSFPHSEIELFYKEAFPRPASFLVQQWIPFQEYNGRPFDIRAVVQKNGRNKWQVTSRVARVANGKGEITNLSQGGEMVSFSELQLKEYYRNIRKFCLETAKAFAKLYPWVGEMGIDLAIDKKGKLWYIETNFCPEKIRWQTIYEIPFEYAYYLLRS